MSGDRLLACPPTVDLAETPPVVVIDGTAVAAWALLDAPITVDALAVRLGEIFDADSATVERDVDPLLAAWQSAGLIVDVP